MRERESISHGQRLTCRLSWRCGGIDALAALTWSWQSLTKAHWMKLWKRCIPEHTFQPLCGKTLMYVLYISHTSLSWPPSYACFSWVPTYLADYVSSTSYFHSLAYICVCCLCLHICLKCSHAVMFFILCCRYSLDNMLNKCCLASDGCSSSGCLADSCVESLPIMM